MRRLVLALTLSSIPACDGGAESPANLIDPEPAGEGVAFDDENPGADVHGKADAPRTYEVPDDLPELLRPEITVSLATKTVHLFDRATGFSAVYPAGPGFLNSAGHSVTPVGFFTTGPDPDNGWYYIERRYVPDYFGGFPFLRLTALNSKAQHTYGFHGPISYTCPDGASQCDLLDRQWFLRHDYVSHGCIRMNVDDIVDMFWMVRDFEEVPVAIIGEEERDAVGQVVDLGTEAVLFAEGEAIPYGSCGTRPDPWSSDDRWASDDC